MCQRANAAYHYSLFMMKRKKKLSEHLASPNEAALSHSNKFDGLRLSPHFTLGELTKTSYQTPDNNEPPLEAIENLITLCDDWLEELRFNYNRLYVLDLSDDYETSRRVEGIVINQGYRSLQVSEAMERAGLHPAKNSNHLRGCAVDIRCAGMEQAIRYLTILLDMSDQNHRDFDELIMERRGTKYWIHFAVRPEGNRRKILFLLE